MAEQEKESTSLVVGDTNSLRMLLARSQNNLASVLPAHMKVDRIMRLALLAAAKDPKVLECTKESVMASLMTAAQLGLEPNGTLGSAYLVPFKNRDKGVMELQLIPGYRGLIDLAKRSGEIARVEARVVYNDDVFKIVLGTNPDIIHEPNPDVEPEYAKIRGFYAVAVFDDGNKQFEWMTKKQVDAIRARSKSSTSGPWVTDYEEMGKKTVTKRASKYWPLSPEKAAQFAAAVEHDNRVETGEIGGLNVVTDTEASISESLRRNTAEKASELRDKVRNTRVSAKVVDSDEEIAEQDRKLLDAEDQGSV